MYESLIDALRRGAAAEALPAAYDAVGANPQDAVARRLLAAALQLNGDHETALATLDEALELAPDDAGLHVERAALLLKGRQLDEAEAALAKAVGLDPNQFLAYVMQGQLALGRGDIVEAERIAKTAARIAPSHPQVAAIEGMVALRRGDADSALAILSQAAQSAPDDPTVRNALGFAYLAKGHLAFAEQAFRKQLEQQPGSVALRGLVADLVRRQGRAAEAADEAAPLLERENVSPGLQRVVGELEVEAGRPERAVAPLKAAFAAMPNDLRTLRVLVEAWRRSGVVDDARATLDAAIAATPENDNLWRARLVFEPFAGAEALAVVERWLDARPDHIPPLQARAAIHDHAGERDEADAIAYQIVAIEPGQAQAELRIVDRLLRDDPAAAAARVRALLAETQSDEVRPLLRQLLGRCLNIAGEAAEAASTWESLQADLAQQRMPLPPLTDASRELPPLAPLPENAPGVLWLSGPPGSCVDRIALNLSAVGGPLLTDRYGPQPPVDPLQRFGTAQELLDGSLDGGFLVSQWRAALPSRGITGGQVFDWLLWWDNALLHAVRPHLPEAVLMIAIRDPRDMLLEWLAYDTPQRFGLASVEAGAQWLAHALGQIAELHEGDLFPHRLLKLDDIAQDPVALANAIGQALETNVPPLPALAPLNFAPGHWRAYAEPLANAFAALTPVAVRLGYPET
jgi:Flp pilus assembly protein TadD